MKANFQLRNAAAWQHAGSSLVESLIALAIGSVACGGAFSINSSQLRLVKSVHESSAASFSLEERVEGLRIATWRQITDAGFVRDTYFGAAPRSVAALPGYSETIKVSAWPDPTVCAPILVEKNNRQPAEVVLSGRGLAEQRMAKIDVRISWKGQGRTRVRELTTMISNGGISRMNLPAMGAAAGSNSTGETAPPEETTPPLAGSPDPDPTPTSAESGNENGKGNVGGKSGKN